MALKTADQLPNMTRTNGADGAVRNPKLAGRWRVFGVALALFFVPMALWALASPISSVPDEPSHAIRAAEVVRGQISTPPWSQNKALSSAVVPEYIAWMHERTCYVNHPGITPACEAPVPGNPNRLVTTGTSAGTNSPAYYAVIGLPTLVLSGDPAIFAMRLLNVLLCAAGLAVLVMQLSTLRRSRWAIAGVVIAVTPMLLFLAGSINPNAIEAISAGALFVTLAAIVRSPGTVRVNWERAILVLLEVAFLVNTRSISLLWVILIVVAVLALSSRAAIAALLRTRSVLTLLVGSVLFSALAVLWFARPSSGNGPLLTHNPLPNFSAAFFYMVEKTFDFASGMVGDFGWLDTPSPAYSAIVWSAAIVVFLIAALIWGSGRSRLVTAWFAVALLLVPPITQGILAPTLGLVWQGRYVLAIFVCLMIAAGMALDEAQAEVPLARQTRTAVLVSLILLGAAQCLSFVWVLRRYVVGTSQHSSLSMITAPKWQPPLTWELLTVLLIAWTVVAVWVGYRRILRPSDDPTPALSSPAPSARKKTVAAG